MLQTGSQATSYRRQASRVALADHQDLRNHGASPHAEPHSYAAMAKDIAQFMNQRGLESGVNLMGHSM